jgi:bifunctional non-homologous end joining protein LigD
MTTTQNLDMDKNPAFNDEKQPGQLMLDELLANAPQGETFTWLKPELICEVNFAEITKDGLLRQASFKGMRIDKQAIDVILETPKDIIETIAGEESKGSTSLSSDQPPSNHFYSAGQRFGNN